MIKTTFSIVIICTTLTLSSPLMSQSDHNHHTHENGAGHDHQSDSDQGTAEKLKLVTGQGDFVFSWDKVLTAAFPKDAIEFEPRMHGVLTRILKQESFIREYPDMVFAQLVPT